MEDDNMQAIESDVLRYEYSTMVLLVDDQAFVAQAVMHLLDGFTDIDLHYCPDAREAVKVAIQMKPTVILQDLVMPGVDGLELVRLFRANPSTAEIPDVSRRPRSCTCRASCVRTSDRPRGGRPSSRG